MKWSLLFIFFTCNVHLALTQSNVRPGKNYAVFFAVSHFSPGWNSLPETIDESYSIKEELKNNYGFECEMVTNPTKQTIIEKLKFYNSNLTDDDQLLLFFSMHGYFDKSSKSGYLIAKDGKNDDIEYGESWLDYYELAKILSRSKAKHILLALDACHSGSFGIRTKGRPTALPDDNADCKSIVAKAMELKGRQFCAAGNQDQKTPAQSKFASSFLESLQQLQQDEVLFFSDLSAQLLRVSNPRPVTGSFLGDQKGPGFVFVRNNSCNTIPVVTLPADPEKELWENVVKQNLIADYEYYLGMYPEGRFKAKAIAEREWLKTVEINSCTGYRNYLSIYKQHRKEVEAKCPDLKKNKAHPISSIADNMILVKGGTFLMGSQNGEEDEMPVHEVSISNFYINKYEVTQKEWRDIMGKNPPYLEFKGCDQCPVNNVNWKDAQIFIRKLNRRTGQNYRLPTEAEWEYAAKGGGNRLKGVQKFSASKLNEIAWYYGNSEKRLHPVGSKSKNELGLYDMIGNAYEWCSDWYGRYTNRKKIDPKGIEFSSTRVCRGGSFGDGETYVNMTNRGAGNPETGTRYIGFRLARSVEK